MSNEEFEKTIKEYNEQKNEQLFNIYFNTTR